MKHLDIKIYGRVQGINFRWHARGLAKKLKITGYVQNISDGSVMVEAEGNSEALEEFLDWCRKGPWLTKVERVEVAEAELKNYFEIRSQL